MPMALVLNGTTGITSANIQDGAVAQVDLAAGVAGNGPAFSAYPSAGLSFSTGTWTKVVYNTKQFDTATAYNTTTGRFTPQVAGYYIIHANSVFTTTADNYSGIYKNGVQTVIAGASTQSTIVSTLLYMNGSTDYVECYAYLSPSTSIFGGVDSSFNGVLVRAA